MDKKIASMVEEKERPLHIAMYSWFAFGHLTSFLQLANKLAERGHKVSFFLPNKTQPKLTPHNHHPHLITFIPITIPAVKGLPCEAETTADVPYEDRSLIMEAMDLTRDTIDSLLSELKPDLVFFDFTEWLPGLARKHGAKSVYYATMFAVSGAYFLPRARAQPGGQDLSRPPPGFPSSKSMITLQAHEARAVGYMVTHMEFGGKGKTMLQRHAVALEACDAFAVKSCREMEGVYCDFIHKVYGKPMLLAGPVVPEQPAAVLDDHLDGWLSGFDKGSVIYCALGSECSLSKDRFQELLLGFELTGMPFYAALKPPIGYETIESALPEGFIERTKGRGVVHGGWVQQQLILQHSSVGCFLTHCGAGSLSEAMVSDCQIVLCPQVTDQFINARMMSLDLKIGVEVEKGEDGVLTKEGICKAIKAVMDLKSEVGREARINQAKWREFLLAKELEEFYISGFVENLLDLVT
ncbi:UDP-glycosyltransferase 79B30-like [Chenopodium quinoa]|uniref:UDP-glycosyltransferase 79B30-like n=1 Tax=Chenopodium quinoa TaxID=63459 RepID=UPI000B77AF22|nr:UDP-glycosyltransferase 79B30-like [Chenopodium quinoa]